MGSSSSRSGQQRPAVVKDLILRMTERNPVTPMKLEDICSHAWVAQVANSLSFTWMHTLCIQQSDMTIAVYNKI